jgi:hypothetical protein
LWSMSPLSSILSLRHLTEVTVIANNASH